VYVNILHRFESLELSYTIHKYYGNLAQVKPRTAVNLYVFIAGYLLLLEPRTLSYVYFISGTLEISIDAGARVRRKCKSIRAVWHEAI